jgi:hypothetical protein
VVSRALLGHLVARHPSPAIVTVIVLDSGSGACGAIRLLCCCFEADRGEHRGDIAVSRTVSSVTDKDSPARPEAAESER